MDMFFFFFFNLDIPPPESSPEAEAGDTESKAGLCSPTFWVRNLQTRWTLPEVRGAAQDEVLMEAGHWD